MPEAKADALSGDARMTAPGCRCCDVLAYGISNSHGPFSVQAIFAVAGRSQATQG